MKRMTLLPLFHFTREIGMKVLYVFIEYKWWICLEARIRHWR